VKFVKESGKTHIYNFTGILVGKRLADISFTFKRQQAWTNFIYKGGKSSIIYSNNFSSISSAGMRTSVRLQPQPPLH
jgi:hypothetical protein